jgi:hypothetical protein
MPRNPTRLNRELVLPDFDLSLALCGQTDPEIFFPQMGDQGSAQKAIEICKQCEVQKQCLIWALTNDEQFGIWGGTTPTQRQHLKGKRLTSRHRVKRELVVDPDILAAVKK